MKYLVKIGLSLALLFPFAGWVNGQSYDLKQKPGLDPAIITGVLDNGMHYYIRANKLPEKRGEFFIATNIGAIQEEDDQNGLAHFTEHMAFNGSKHFAGKSMLNYLATIGVRFGQNVNAGTGVEQTIYNLSNVPLNREGVLDSCLLILHDWAHYVTFDPKEVDLERGVIREEWRMYGSADERMSNKLMPVIYQGSKYAKRDVIGDTAVINHFKYSTLTDFYNKWYRTDLQAVVVVGDIDPRLVELKIKRLFNEIPRVENPAIKEIYPVTDNKEPLIATATDKEATETQLEVIFKHPSFNDADKDLGYMRTILERSLINAMFSQRMNDLTRTENPPFISSYCYYGGFTKTRDAFYGVAQAKNNEGVKALTALLTEIERMKRFGFTQGELDRAKSNLLRNYESRYLDRDKRKNRELIYPIVFNFLINNPNPGIEFEYQFAKAQIPGMGLEEINAMAKGFVTDENMIVTSTGPDKEGIFVPTVEEMKKVVETYKTQKIDAYVDKMAGMKLITKEPVPGKVVSTDVNNVMGATEWTLSNGMKVIFKPTDIKEDELIIRGFSAGGICLLKDEDLPSANLLGSAVTDMGIGNFSRTDLNKLLAGKKANVMVSLSSDQDIISSRTSPKDLETSLQLIYLSFTQPRWNDNDYKTWYEKQKAEYINADAEPRKAFRDTIKVMNNNHSKRDRPMTYKTLEMISLDKFKHIYSDRFADPGNFTFQFTGKINTEEAKPLIEKYLASLLTVKRNEVLRDDGIRPPAGKAVNDFKRESTTPRTSVYVNYNGLTEYTPQNKLLLSAIRHCLELRYTESIREDEGGTYSVMVLSTLFKFPEVRYRIVVSFDTDPLKADKLVGIVHREITKMIESGPTETDLQKAKEYFLKQRQEDLKENNWLSQILTDYYFYGMDNLTFYNEKVKELTVKSVHDYARKTLSQGNVVEVIMRP
jgi:zinc protease